MKFENPDDEIGEELGELASTTIEPDTLEEIESPFEHDKENPEDPSLLQSRNIVLSAQVVSASYDTANPSPDRDSSQQESMSNTIVYSEKRHGSWSDVRRACMFSGLSTVSYSKW